MHPKGPAVLPGSGASDKERGRIEKKKNQLKDRKWTEQTQTLPGNQVKQWTFSFEVLTSLSCHLLCPFWWLLYKVQGTHKAFATSFPHRTYSRIGRESERERNEKKAKEVEGWIEKKSTPSFPSNVQCPKDKERERRGLNIKCQNAEHRMQCNWNQSPAGRLLYCIIVAQRKSPARKLFLYSFSSSLSSLGPTSGIYNPIANCIFHSPKYIHTHHSYLILPLHRATYTRWICIFSFLSLLSLLFLSFLFLSFCSLLPFDSIEITAT